MTRLRYNNCYGRLSQQQLIGDQTIQLSAPLTQNDGQPIPTIAAPNTLDISLEPNTPNFEVERVTAYTQGALTATVTRGIYGAAKYHGASAPWSHDPTASDFNQTQFGIDTAASDIGVETFGAAASAGSTGLAADAGHVHLMPALDATAADIGVEAFGASAAAGSTGKAADAGHVHQLPSVTGVVWPLANSSDESFQPDGVANSALNLKNNPSAVNGLQVTGTATGSDPVLATVGSDTNRGLVLNSKGTGNVSIYTPGTATGSVVLGGSAAAGTTGQVALTATGVASGVNGVTVTQAATGGAPSIAATGSDTNIPLNIVTKGTGSLQVNGAAGSSGQVLTSNGSGAAPTWTTPSGGTLAWPLTNTGDESFRPNNVANNVLTLHNNAAAISGVTITGTATGNPPQITGSDGLFIYASKSTTAGDIAFFPDQLTTAILVLSSTGSSTTGQLILAGRASSSDVNVDAAGGGTIRFNTNGGTGSVTMCASSGTAAFTVTGVASGANGLTVTGKTAGNSPTVAATGTDTNIDLTVSGKGTGVVNFGYATVALGGGAAPTLGTIGGSGPATAAQNSWLQVKINGTTSWLPVWR